MMRWLGFVASGLAAGVFSGSLGVGGALLATPLIRFLGVAPYLAVGTTVPVLLPTTLTGAYTYRKAGLVDLRVAAWTASGGVAGAVVGALSTHRVDGHLLMLATSALLFVMALRTLPSRAELGPREARFRSSLSLVVLGLIAGLFSGLLGIGGGFILVPVYIRLFGLPIKTALGTSLAAISVAALPNLVAQQIVGNIDWPVAGLLAIGVIPGARAGSLLSIRAPERILRVLVPLLILAVAIVYAVVELKALAR